MRVHENIHDAYLGALKDVWYEPEYICAPRGLKIKEITDYSFKILNPVAEPIVTKDLERNATIASYTEKETFLYDSCTNRVEDFAKASKFWNKLANPDGTINSAYGYLIWNKKSHGNGEYEYGKDIWGEECLRTPWEWCVEALKTDRDTRQALLRFSLPEHFWKGNKDFTCTMHGNWQIRENRLNFSVVMRSNDLVLGTAFDIPWFMGLMDKMLDELRTVYPELRKGAYTHTAHSMHIYEKDADRVLKMLGYKDGQT